MRIRNVRLRSFKRFSDTTVGEIPQSARLVVLMGPNGCGKSSLIDAVAFWHRRHWRFDYGWDETYHQKQMVGALEDFSQMVSVDFYNERPLRNEDKRKAVYVRTAYRNDPEFKLDTLNRVGPAVEESRFSRLIDNDQVVSLNYRRLVSEGFEYVYEKGAPEETLEQFRERSVGGIRAAMERLFPGLYLNGLGDPLRNGTFKFDKGVSGGFLYKNLSGGEKSAFDLLLDILVKKREFDDTVFLIDEPEAHISAALQGKLLQELFDAVTGASQLWIATHSLGMMRKARELSVSNPGEVVFLDFDGVNFDVNSAIKPTPLGKPFWKRAMRVALDDFAGYVGPEKVVLCEGGAVGGGADFDANCYNSIFMDTHPNVLFMGVGNSDDVQNDPKGVERVIRGISEKVVVVRLIDRDDRREDEIDTLARRGVRVLSLRNIESYLLGDEVLTASCKSLGDVTKAMALIEVKQQSIKNSVAKGGAADDLKRVAGDVYNAAKALFPDQKLGADKRSFMSGVCAKEIEPHTNIYKKLCRDIFDG